MKNLTSNQFPKGKVKLCKNDVCLEASGDFAKVITVALVFTIICIGIAALAKA